MSDICIKMLKKDKISTTDMMSSSLDGYLICLNLIVEVISLINYYGSRIRHHIL